jgi:two-component system cell cycle sensor histidine kinase/response regulator CckA
MNESNSQNPNSSRSVLIIDDEELIRNLARDVLEMNDFHVLCAENGIDGIALYKKNKEHIACIILDLTMPRMSGRETYQQLKQIDKNAKIILSTGHGRDKMAQEIIALGVHGVIQKPYRIEDLLRLVQTTMNT